MKEINPAELERKQVYKLLIGSLVPRPIAWVSTRSREGTPNLAPFSYFTAVSANPPMVLFCPGIRSTDGGQKDTYHNVRETGEFVINFVNEALAEAMVATSVEAAPEVDEFARAGLTPLPSRHVNVPRVEGSPIQFECKLHQIVSAGDGHVVIGEVLWMHFADDVLQENHYVDVAAYQPIGRMAGSGYVHLRDFFEMQRPPSEV